MPAKMARSAPRPLFGLPEVTVAVRIALLPCRESGKPRVFTAVRGVIWRIPVNMKDSTVAQDAITSAARIANSG
jgi:hypothetical protein